MTRIFFFDTETTDLNDPRIVQFAGIMIDDRGEKGRFEIRQINQNFNPQKKSDPRAVAVTGLTDEYVANFDTIHTDFKELLAHMKKADICVAYNADFDFKVMANEAKRLGVAFNKSDYVIEDPMKPLTNICKLPKDRGYGYKRPKLQEAYKFLFGEEFEDAHDALADIRATIKVFYGLKEYQQNEEKNIQNGE